MGGWGGGGGLVAWLSIFIGERVGGGGLLLCLFVLFCLGFFVLFTG